MDWRDRAARNEEIFRGVNERIDETAQRHGFDQTLTFHCECANGACTATFDMAAQEYERIAADPARFVVVPTHENGLVETVVERASGYVVVEKVGEARKQIERDHPRPRHAD